MPTRGKTRNPDRLSTIMPSCTQGPMTYYWPWTTLQDHVVPERVWTSDLRCGFVKVTRKILFRQFSNLQNFNSHRSLDSRSPQSPASNKMAALVGAHAITCGSIPLWSIALIKNTVCRKLFSTATQATAYNLNWMSWKESTVNEVIRWPLRSNNIRTFKSLLKSHLINFQNTQ